MGYLMSKPSLLKNRSCTIQPIIKWNKGVHTFPMSISQKVNLKAQLEFKLASYDVTVQNVSHYTTGILPEREEATSILLQSMSHYHCYIRIYFQH